MGELACPQCGNPNLDVDEQNSVVYCKKCGFAVKVDPQTGEAVPLAPGGQTPAIGGAALPPQVEKTVFGMDPLTFWMGGFAILLLLFFLGILRDPVTLLLLVVVLTLVWWFKR